MHVHGKSNAMILLEKQRVYGASAKKNQKEYGVYLPHILVDQRRQVLNPPCTKNYYSVSPNNSGKKLECSGYKNDINWALISKTYTQKNSKDIIKKNAAVFVLFFCIEEKDQ